MPTKDPKFNIGNYTEENLFRIRRMVKVILNQIELSGWKIIFRTIKIPFETLTREGFGYEESKTMIGVINKISNKGLFKVLNEEAYEPLLTEVNMFAFDDVDDNMLEFRKKELLNDWLDGKGRMISATKSDLENQLIIEFIHKKLVRKDDFFGLMGNLIAVIDANLRKIIKLNTGQKQNTTIKDRLFREDLSPEFSVGDLACYSDGTIRYKREIVPLRNQIKDLCRIFIKRPDRLITIDDIKENIINADKRKNTTSRTIAKYISELHNSLKVYFKKDVIFNQKEEGWYLKVN